ncbi:hypothetical protein T439DRAFT_149038 [Meredithblackwellia eburnea MCA 4105]
MSSMVSKALPKDSKSAAPGGKGATAATGNVGSPVGTPGSSTGPIITPIIGGASAAGAKKKKKSVRWKPDEEIEAVRYIEKAIYDDDQNASIPIYMDADDGEERWKLMDEQEGLTMHLNLEDDDLEDEDEFEWYESFELMPKIPPYPVQSVEADIQAAREASVMEVDYPDADDQPPTPGEYLIHQAASEHVETVPPVTIPLGERLANDQDVQEEISRAQLSGVTPSMAAEQNDVAALLGSLQPLSGPDPTSLNALAEALKKFNGTPVLGQPGFGQPAFHHQGGPYNAPADNGWGNPGHAFPQQANWNMVPMGAPTPTGPSEVWSNKPGGGTGRVFKGKKKSNVCKFYKLPRGCDWGDRCTLFLHINSTQGSYHVAGGRRVRLDQLTDAPLPNHSQASTVMRTSTASLLL